MTTEFVDTVHQTIYPGDCDVMGHLNTRHYTALFDHAMWQLLRHLGVDDPYGPGATVGWADVETVTTYRREVNVGSCVRVRSRLVRVGTKSLASEHVLVVESDQDERAINRTTSVRLDLVSHRSIEVPEKLRVHRVQR
jgi:acyl-CoA thioester hydrolase